MVAQGFKNTEIGVIPEDWQEGTFEDYLEGFSSGMTPYRAIKEYYEGDIPWITSGELNYNIIYDTNEKITKDAVLKTNLKIIPSGTFLIAITGLEAAGTRGSCALTGIRATTNQSCMALYPKKGLLMTDYLFHYYVRYGDRLALKYCQGTKQQSYNAVTAKKLPIAFPKSLPEQKAIAEALSDADAWIANLEQLIAKKRLIKQGAMQQLLSPKDDWEVRKLGECSFITKLAGFEYSLHFNSYKDEGEIVVIRGTNITRNKLDLSDIKTIPIKTSNYLLRSKLYKNDLVFAYVGTIGPIYLVEENDRFHLGPNTAKITVNVNLNSMFLYHYFTSSYIKNEIIEHTSIGAQPSLSMSKIRSFKLSFPDLEEQTRIATILSDMDSEKESLEKQLAKARQIKQGMMQELLTGRVRLV